MIVINLFACISLLAISLLIIRYKFTDRLIMSAFFSFIWLFQSSTLIFSSNKLRAVSGSILSPNYLSSLPYGEIIFFASTTGFIFFLFTAKFSLIKQLVLATVLWLLLEVLLTTLAVKLFQANTTILSILICLFPAIILAKFSFERSHPITRNLLQILPWISLLLWFIPSLIFHVSEQSWRPLTERILVNNLILMLPLTFPALLLGSAIYQFASKGNGTPFPYDPPDKLIYSGIYGYLSNPMQVGICLLMGYWGWILDSVIVSTTGLVAVLLFIVFKDICNGSCQISQLDEQWQSYQQAVPKWLPRSTPWKP